VVLKQIKTCSWVPTGLKTKNNCAFEDQQQFTRPTYPKNSCAGDRLPALWKISLLFYPSVNYKKLIDIYGEQRIPALQRVVKLSSGVATKKEF
jgi:hypothetical protein